MDVQYTAGDWLWKLEALYRGGQRDRFGAERAYAAYIAGFEYTLRDPFGDGADVGASGRASARQPRRGGGDTVSG